MGELGLQASRAPGLTANSAKPCPIALAKYTRQNAQAALVAPGTCRHTRRSGGVNASGRHTVTCCLHARRKQCHAMPACLPACLPLQCTQPAGVPGNPRGRSPPRCRWPPPPQSRHAQGPAAVQAPAPRPPPVRARVQGVRELGQHRTRQSCQNGLSGVISGQRATGASQWVRKPVRSCQV